MEIPTTNISDMSLYQNEWREKKEIERRDTLRHRLLDYFPQFSGHVHGIFEEYVLDDKPREAMSFAFRADDMRLYVARYNTRQNVMTLVPVYLVSRHNVLQLKTEE